MLTDGNEYSEGVYILPRGGILAKTSDGFIQVGATPETIKDTMVKEGDVPRIYLLPEKLFSFDYGISVADFEFPIYYNFFIKNRKTFLLGSSDDLKKIEQVLKEALFGPSRINIRGDYYKYDVLPELKKEMGFFHYSSFLKRPITLLDLLEFIPLHRGENVNIGHINIINYDERNYLVKDIEKDFFLPKSFVFPKISMPHYSRSGNFSPPLFGITIIGSGHGFDPDEKTAGFIIWINKKGILVDPPVNSTQWLEENKINPKLIGDLILTHCHADHDSGTLQKILEERRINLHTTKTIKNSFLNKYSVLTDIPYKFFEKLFNFEQVIIREPHNILGADFLFKYSFHSIPTIWFEIKYQDKSFVYSSDMYNYPPDIKNLPQKKIMSTKRASEFLNFPWNSSIILHEAGIPPIHTPIKILEDLEPEIRENLYLIHISGKNIPKEKGLKLGKSGVENTIVCPVADLNPDIYEEKADIISNVDLFKDIKLNQDIIGRAYYEYFKAGEFIVRSGDRGDKFFIILSGEAMVNVQGKDLKVYSTYDYFGETSIIFDIPRNADVYAKTNLKLLVMKSDDLLELIKDTGIIEKAKNLAVMRDLESWQLFNESTLFGNFSSTQKTELQVIMDYEVITKKKQIIKCGEKACYAYLIKNGNIDIYKNNKLVYEARRGDFISAISFLNSGGSYNFDAYSRVLVEVFKIDMKELRKILDKNPGMRIKFIKLNPLNKF